jgi:hypothetical protein
MQQPYIQPADNISLGHALLHTARRPLRTLLAAWSWKTALFSALLRASIFFASNLHTGHGHAVRAMLIEAAFSMLASGFLGGVTQCVRHARPVWATALLVWVGLPAVMLAAQFGVHRLGGTPHMRSGLIASFVFASIASGFTWYAMRRGALLAGDEGMTLLEEARHMPHVVWGFVLAGPRAVLSFAGRSTH